MGVSTVLLSDLRFHGWALKHDNPRRFVEPLIGRSVVWYSWYRILAVMFVATAFLFALAQCNGLRGVLHFPIWGYFISLVNSVLFAVCVMRHRRMQQSSSKVQPKDITMKGNWSEIRRSKRSKSISKPVEIVTSFPLSFKIIWVMHYISVYSAFTSVIFHVSGLFKGEENVYRRNSWLVDVDETNIHAGFAAYTFLDFWLIGITARLLHFYIMLLYAIVYNLTLLIYTVVEGTSSGDERAIVQYDVADFNSVKRTSTSAMFFVCSTVLFPITIHLVYYVLYVTKLYIYDSVAAYKRARKARLMAAPVPVSQPEDVKSEKGDGLDSPPLDAETMVKVQDNIPGLAGSADKLGPEAAPVGRAAERRRTVTTLVDSDSLQAATSSRRQSKAGSGDVKTWSAGPGHRTSRSGSMMESKTIGEQLGYATNPLFEEDDFTVIVDPE